VLTPVKLVRQNSKKNFKKEAAMSKFNYNKQRHLELLKKSKEKVLTSTEKLELDEYSGCLDQCLDWETKDQYLELLEKLISGKISSFNFYLQFLKRNNLNCKVFHSLIDNFFLLSPHKKSEEFANFIAEIMEVCMSYSEVFEADIFEAYVPRDTASTDLEFKCSIEKIYLKIQNLLNEE